MKLDYMLQVTKVDSCSDAILNLKEIGIHCEAFFNKLQLVKFSLDTNIFIEFINKAGKNSFFDSNGILINNKAQSAFGYKVKVNYHYHGSSPAQKSCGIILI